MLLHPAEGRWPEHATADRLGLALGLAALAAGGSSPDRWEAFRAALGGLARRLAAAEPGPLPGDLVSLDALGAPGWLEVIGWEGHGRTSLEVELVSAAGGVAPRLSEKPDEPGPVREVAALVLLIALAADDDPERLVLALGIEGVLAWFRESDRRAAPRNALSFALAHVRTRLHEAGRAVPAGI